MTEKVFLAGATGAIGSALIPLLHRAGFEIYGGTRRQERASELDAKGVIPVVVDVFDAAALREALARISPASVVHQLTDLPRGLDPSQLSEGVVRNARIRSEGTGNLVKAAKAAGAKRLVAQSIAWAYAPGAKPFTEEQPLDTNAEGLRGTSVGGVIALETAVLGAGEMTGTVLRYGQLYGPGTGSETPTGASPVHVEAAAWAALLALQQSPGGIFNVTEESVDVSSMKVKSVLGWSAEMRILDRTR
jgi:nucleoside-diphosphate-sugar epimerase